MIKQTNKKHLLSFFAITIAILGFSYTAQADILSPGIIDSCGELASPGTYTLSTTTTNFDSVGALCFKISSDGVTIDGQGVTIQANGTVPLAIDARSYDQDNPTQLLSGGDGYSVTVANLYLKGFTRDIDASGNADGNGSGVKGGYGGDAGELDLYYSDIKNITAKGGNSETKDYGGLGGDLYIFGSADLDISSSTIDLAGGTGTTGSDSAGGLYLTYTSTFKHGDVTLSELSYIIVNDEALTISYPGGTWPISPGSISTCGTLLGPGTFTLSSNIGSEASPISGSCFIIASDEVTINGSGHSIITSGDNTSYAIEAGDHSDFVLGTTTVSSYANLINSSSSVTINGETLDLKNKHIVADSLSLNYTTLLKDGATVSDLSDLTINGLDIGAFSAGVFDFYMPIGIQGLTEGEYVFNWNDVSIDWNPLGISGSAACYYSYDSWVSTSTADCSGNGTEIHPPSTTGIATLSLKVDFSEGYVASSSVTFGANDWVEQSGSGQHYWSSITSSADGSKLAAVDGGYGYIYTSTDGGESWTPQTDSGQHIWVSIISSADGSKLVGGTYDGYILTSVDGGETWIEKINIYDIEGVDKDFLSSWRLVMSSDGSRIVAMFLTEGDGNFVGRVAVSVDGGQTWTRRVSQVTHGWQSIASTADASRLVAIEGDGNEGRVFIYSDLNTEIRIDPLIPSNGQTTASWNPYISWGNAVYCQYTYDGSDITYETNCALNGSNLEKPSYGAHTLDISATDRYNNTVSKSISFTYELLPRIVSPVSGYISDWSPSVIWDVGNNQNLVSCKYTYDYWTTTSIADCSKNGSDITPPEGGGEHTLTVDIEDEDGNTGGAEVTFTSGWRTLGTAPDSFTSIASSADGKKLVAVGGANYGAIWTSSDYGETWTITDGSNGTTDTMFHTWIDVTSSADGTKLAAITDDYDGVWVSTDSGRTWTVSPNTGEQVWQAITSSADGSTLAVVNVATPIIVSHDFGQSWLVADGENGTSYTGDMSWNYITSSADGSKLVVSESESYIHTSTDGGKNWTPQTDSGQHVWTSITSSADGSKLAAVENGDGEGGYIYTSTDGGESWTPQTDPGQHIWASIISSTDGSKLAAVDYGGYIYLSTDGGENWTPQTDSGSHSWSNITSSADGSRLVVIDKDSSTLYSYSDLAADPKIEVFSLFDGGEVVASLWNSDISWGRATHCEYSYDSGATTTVNCALNGSGIELPDSFGSHTLHLYASNSWGGSAGKDVEFTTSLEARIVSPEAGQVMSWSPSVVWDVYGTGNIETCEYSYDNWTSTSTVDCSKNGSDIKPPSGEGSHTLVVRIVDGDLNEGYSQVTFTSGWYQVPAGPGFNQLAMSSDGRVLAGNRDGNLLASTDFGKTWLSSAHNSSVSFNHTVSSADGSRLASINLRTMVIMTSSDYGETWIDIDGGNGTTDTTNHSWSSLASSADGSRLVASETEGAIWLSSDYGRTWIAVDGSGGMTDTTNHGWTGVYSSADGKKLAAIDIGTPAIWVSSNYGREWTILNGDNDTTDTTWYEWRSVAISADGSVLAAVAGNQSVWVSTDSGMTWVEHDESVAFVTGDEGEIPLYAYDIAISADGMNLVVAIGDGAEFGAVYLSMDQGMSWTKQNISSGSSYLVKSSSDGSKLLAVGVNNGDIHLYIYSSLDPDLKADIVVPQQGQIMTTWNPYVSWGSAKLCEYSMDGGATTTAICADNGSDIARPSSSQDTHTLNISATDWNGVTASKGVDFSYNFYVWCSTEDQGWATLGNWYTDSDCGFGHHASAFPSGEYDAVIFGPDEPIVTDITFTMPVNIDVSALSGDAALAGITFANDTVGNTSFILGNATFNNGSTNGYMIDGNATFNDSYNLSSSTITGSVTANGASVIGGTINTHVVLNGESYVDTGAKISSDLIINSTYFNGEVSTTSVLTLSQNAVLNGTIGGSIYNSTRSHRVTSFIFRDNSYNTSAITGTTSFYDAAYNVGTITGTATFNNDSPFTIGTVIGTTTLAGTSQTITGSSTTDILVKSGTYKDTLYISSGAKLNVTDNAIITGSNSGNLITIRSTTPGSYANINLNGNANLDFIRLRDIHNSGSTVDLRGKTAYNDGGNSGFTFGSSASAGQHPSSSGGTITYVPKSSGSTGGDPGGGNNTGGSNDGGDTGASNGRSSWSRQVSSGSRLADSSLFTVMPTVAKLPSLDLSPLPTFGTVTTKNTFSLGSGIKSFLFSPISEKFKKIGYIASAGIAYNKDLLRIQKLPIEISSTTLSSGVFLVASSSKPLKVYASYDEKYGIYQFIKAYTSSILDISLVPEKKSLLGGSFDGQVIKFIAVSGAKTIATTIQVPQEPGRYWLKADAASTALAIDVTAAPKVEVKKMVPWWLKIITFGLIK